MIGGSLFVCHCNVCITAALRERVFRGIGHIWLHSAHLERHKPEADRIGASLVQPEVDERIEAAFFAVGDPRLQQILSDG